MSESKPLVIHGWTVFAHPMFIAQLESQEQQVQALKQKDPEGYSKKNASKRLAAIVNLAFNIIPQDPSRPEYRQGGTLGEDRKHWFRAKFFQQYRLFFRYHAAAKIIVLAWVNDENTKRAYESSEDAEEREPTHLPLQKPSLPLMLFLLISSLNCWLLTSRSPQNLV